MAQKTAPFNFIDSASHGYQFIWHKRSTILRLAVPVFILKLLTYIAIFTLGYGEEYMHQGLILLPAAFAEGWLLALLIRMAMFQEHPITLMKPANPAHTNILLASTIIFVLIKLITALLAALAMQNGLAELQTDLQTQQDTEQNLGAFLLAVAGFTLILWSFRLIWLYIPTAMNIPPLQFLKRIKPFSSSFYLIALWMICSLPIMMVLMFIMQFINIIFPISGEEISLIHRYAIITIQSITELIVSIISTIAIAYAIHALMFKKEKP